MVSVNMRLHKNLALAIVCMTALSCSGGHDGTGSISFTLKSVPEKSSIPNARMDCGDVATVEVVVFDGTGAQIAHGGPWDCTSHSGALDNIPAGTSRALKVIAKDGSGEPTQWGYVKNVAVANGQTTNIGEITISGAGPMEFVAGGCFDMGDTFGDGAPNELPAHEVCLDGYFMDAYEMTLRRFMNNGGSGGYGCTNDIGCPVRNVSWEMANDFCSVNGKRLPTEAEWEFAARERGRHVRFGNGSDNIECNSANWVDCWGSASRETLPVGSLPPNSLGLYEMSGNVFEWVWDWYDNGYYSSSPKQNPRGPDSGTKRVARGGSVFTIKDSLRATYRNGYDPVDQFALAFSGFRCAL